MNFEVRFKSITMRWFLGVFLITAVGVMIAASVLSMIISSINIERVCTAAEEYAYEFETLSSSTQESFADAAIMLSEKFEHKNKVEVQVLDKTGKVIVSTTGFQQTDEAISDFNQALVSKSEQAVFNGKNTGGERIMAQSRLLYDSDGNLLGGYRWIVSLHRVNLRITTIVCIIVAVALGILGICAMSGLFFIKSIVKPIRDVSNTARKIAMGDFKSKMEIGKNDEIGELCDTINYMANELENAETIKNDFISSVSHELRTPLTAIRGWGETAKMSVGTDEELVSRGLEVVLSEADRLSGLVEELLDFSRMQTGRLTVNTMPLDVSELLRSAADMYTELARQNGIELSFTMPKIHSVVLGDSDRLKQVFINIIDNAVKYTEKGGLVLVTQAVEENCVQIVVKDTGVGIPASDIDRVKEKFFKSNKTVRGSGIGLAVADEIIKQHQGLFFIESIEGVGTTATVVLPLYEPDEDEPATETVETIIEAQSDIGSQNDIEGEI